MQATWLKNARHVVFYSEADIASLPAVGLKPPPGEELVGGGAWKNFPALVDLHLRYPRKKWIFFNDDDTYVFVDNLLTVLGGHDPDRDFYLGLYWTPRVDMEWKEVQIAYASGGAGYGISRGLLNKLSRRMDACHRNFTRWAGDIRVGKCIADLGVRITPEVGFPASGSGPLPRQIVIDLPDQISDLVGNGLDNAGLFYCIPEAQPFQDVILPDQDGENFDTDDNHATLYSGIGWGESGVDELGNSFDYLGFGLGGGAGRLGELIIEPGEVVTLNTDSQEFPLPEQVRDLLDNSEPGVDYDVADPSTWPTITPSTMPARM